MTRRRHQVSQTVCVGLLCWALLAEQARSSGTVCVSCNISSTAAGSKFGAVRTEHAQGWCVLHSFAGMHVSAGGRSILIMCIQRQQQLACKQLFFRLLLTQMNSSCLVSWPVFHVAGSWTEPGLSITCDPPGACTALPGRLLMQAASKHGCCSKPSDGGTGFSSSEDLAICVSTVHAVHSTPCCQQHGVQHEVYSNRVQRAPGLETALKLPQVPWRIPTR
jgi:hypothetical protein